MNPVSRAIFRFTLRSRASRQGLGIALLASFFLLGLYAMVTMLLASGSTLPFTDPWRRTALRLAADSSLILSCVILPLHLVQASNRFVNSFLPFALSAGFFRFSFAWALPSLAFLAALPFVALAGILSLVLGGDVLFLLSSSLAASLLALPLCHFVEQALAARYPYQGNTAGKQGARIYILNVSATFGLLILAFFLSELWSLGGAAFAPLFVGIALGIAALLTVLMPRVLDRQRDRILEGMKGAFVDKDR